LVIDLKSLRRLAAFIKPILERQRGGRPIESSAGDSIVDMPHRLDESSTGSDGGAGADGREGIPVAAAPKMIAADGDIDVQTKAVSR